MTSGQHPTTCIVLAGGLGTRLQSAVADLPKCLAPIGNRSFLQIQLSALAHAGVNDVVLSLGHLADKVIAAMVTMQKELPVRHVVECERLGTGGAIVHVLDQLGLDEVLVVNGDTFLDGDVGQMLAPLNRADGELFRMALIRVPDRTRFGGVEVDLDARVAKFREKGLGGPGLINAGLYRLCREAFANAGAQAFSLETDVLPELAHSGGVWSAVIDGKFTDIGVPEDYFRFCDEHAR